MTAKPIDRFLPWLAYPLVMTAAVALYLLMLRQGQPLTLSTYLPVLMAVGFVILFEKLIPHFQEWKPKAEEIKNDLWFMVVVQIALPQLLAIIVALALIAQVRAFDFYTSFHVWPHRWPIGAQAVLMVVVVDFFRYWLHRAAHRVPLLWRLHAVHHSPPKLYSLNVGRFHPLEKVLQFLLDTVPFVLIGVDERVVAFYFVLYAANGFFQHSNIRLRYGFLNYIVGSAETHRWHHSRDPRESNSNYGNNIIIWDLVFGTWFLPKDRTIRDLGLLNRRYPQGFITLLKTPFITGIAERSVPVAGMQELISRALASIAICFYRIRYWRPLVRATHRPLATQQNVLRRVLMKNQGTRFGREHHFDGIESLQDFRRQVPVQTYETLRPYIFEQDRSGTAALTSEHPLMYATTSGTTSEPKYLPVLSSTIRDYVAQQRLLSCYQHQVCPEVFHGKALGIVSPAVEGYLDSGTPYGSVSGYIYQTMPRIIQRRYVVPSAVFEIKDYPVKYKLILRLALAERNITYLGSANPSTFLRLLAVLNENREELIESVDTGTFEPLNALAPDIRRKIEPRMHADRARAQELRAFKNKKEITFADIWPTIRLLTIWTGGSCGIALEALKTKLPADVTVVELGYVSSEFRGTLTVDSKTNAGVPTLEHNFFEFVERDKWDSGAAEFLTIDQLAEGGDYYVIVTNGAGLYRYFMNDIVRVTGFYQRTPLLKFLQKGKGVTSITGEKMYETHILEAMTDTEKEFNFTSVFFIALADAHAQRYELYVETHELTHSRIADLARFIDQRLCEHNIEYRAKRESGRLASPTLYVLRPGTAEHYKQYCVSRGQREGQFKHMALQGKNDVAFPFERHVTISSAERSHG